jgi:hypothetical protein
MTNEPAPRSFRPVPLVLGSLAVLTALVVLAIGGVALWADQTQRDTDGYLTSPEGLLATPTNALVSETATINVGAADWVLTPDRFGTVRVHARGPHGLPVFLGIGPAADVDDYLDGVGHSVVTDVGYGPFSAGYERVEGTASPAPPAGQGFWATSTEGTGDRVVTWRVTSGDWKLVILNPDGSAGVEAYTSFGVRAAFLGALAWTLVGVGTALLLLGSVLIVLGASGRRTPPATTPAAPAGPPPAAAQPAGRELAGTSTGREERS